MSTMSSGTLPSTDRHNGMGLFDDHDRSVRKYRLTGAGTPGHKEECKTSIEDSES